MTKAAAKLRKEAAQARHKIERKGTLIRLANRRIQKWERKRVGKRKGTPARERCERKLTLWRRRKHDAIYARHNWQQILADALKSLAVHTPAPRKLLRVALGYIGEKEGGAFHRKAVAFVGALLSWPWCSISVAEWLHEALGYDRSELPATAPYSGSWAAWSGGKRVAIHNRQPGDILIFDWGDGGMTDHVAVMNSQTDHVGGNQDDAVNLHTTYPGAIVFVIRPRKKAS